MLASAEDSALLLALLLHRSGKTRARVSERTVRVVSGRSRMLREAFVSNMQVALEELGVLMTRLRRGGFVLIAISALEGTASIKAAAYISEEVKSLRKGALKEEAVLAELGIDDSDNDPEDD